MPPGLSPLTCTVSSVLCDARDGRNTRFSFLHPASVSAEVSRIAHVNCERTSISRLRLGRRFQLRDPIAGQYLPNIRLPAEQYILYAVAQLCVAFADVHRNRKSEWNARRIHLRRDPLQSQSIAILLCE